MDRQRERLFAVLDRLCGRAGVWISGPPGAGKTTLVATYLDARKREAIWYQVDPGDNDPSTFFHYFGLALGGNAVHRRLPVLSPEHLQDLRSFARRYFREVFLRNGHCLEETPSSASYAAPIRM